MKKMLASVLLSFLVLSTRAEALIFGTSAGAFTALTAAVAATDSVNVDGYDVCAVLMDLTAGTATGNLQCSVDNGTTWIDCGSPTSATADALLLVAIGTTQSYPPVGLMRPKLSACGGCNVVFSWHCAG